MLETGFRLHYVSHGLAQRRVVLKPMRLCK
jgi:hypothetical protein